MAAWYCSSVAYTAVAQFTISHSYLIGDIVRQLAAPAVGSERCFRCTTSGTSGGSESTWTLTKGATTTQGTAVFTEVTGNSTFNWSAPFAGLISLAASSWLSAGDSVYVSSDHAETASTAISITMANVGNLVVISVNRAGSVPPVVGDILAGATVTQTGSITTMTVSNTSGQGPYYDGLTFVCSGSTGGGITLGSTISSQYFKNCAFQLGASVGLKIFPNGNYATVWDNCTVQFGVVSQSIVLGVGRFTWVNTANAITGATIPTNLFTSSTGVPSAYVTIQGVDFSALDTTFVQNTGVPLTFKLFDCKLNSSLTISTTFFSPGTYIELINCDSTTGYRNEVYQFGGTLTTETVVTKSSGATDGVQPVSWKMTSNAAPTQVQPSLIGMASLPIYYWLTTTGSAVTATIELINGSAAASALSNADIWLEARYLGDTSDPLASIVSSGLATPLTGSSTVTASTASWPAVWNPNDLTMTTLTGSNLIATKSSAFNGGARSMTYASTGLLYEEVTIGTTSTTWRCGLSTSSFVLTGGLGVATSGVAYIPNTGQVLINNSVISTIMTATSADVLGYAWDFTHSKVWIRKNAGNWNNDVIGNQNPATNTGGISLATLAAGPYYVTFADTASSTASATVNFGATSFANAAPSGFSAWNTVTCGQKMQVTFTPRKVGLIQATIKLGKLNATAYVDPLITVA